MSTPVGPRRSAERLRENRDLPDGELIGLLRTDRSELRENADAVRRENYGTDVYVRGLIEISNYCKNNCTYCGIRRDRFGLARYRLCVDDVLACCEAGYALGFRTFVLQGGEDPHDTDERVCAMVSGIKERYPDCAVTLSLGEKTRESYQAYFDAGADRYLLRHETADAEHYRRLHPKGMELQSRLDCLRTLKEIGYQVGSGFMVGSPYQTEEHLLKDIRFLQRLRPAMIGIGPYLPHKDTPFSGFAPGSLELTLRLISILRLMFPYALIPATTALGTLAPDGRERGLLAGANVVMPNLSPPKVRGLYALYDNKLSTGVESAEGLDALRRQVEKIGYQIVIHRGDVKGELEYDQSLL